MKYSGIRQIWAVAAALLLGCMVDRSHGSSSSSTTTTTTHSGRRTFGVHRLQYRHMTNANTNNINNVPTSLLELRGGVSKRKATSAGAAKTVTGKKKLGKTKDEVGSPTDDFQAFLKTVPKFTRYYLGGMVAITILGNVIGEERAHAAFSLDPTRILMGAELWRPITAACFMGAPSMKWILNLYNVFTYGSRLENAYKGSQFLVFMATVVTLSGILSAFVGQPFITQAVISSMLHVLARTTPKEQVKWVVVNVALVWLPYLDAVADYFNAQGGFSAFIPHIIGILAGHFYFFHKVLWPKTENGQDWLIAPDFMVSIVDGKDAVNKALKKTKRKGGGRKLGSSTASAAA